MRPRTAIRTLPILPWLLLLPVADASAADWKWSVTPYAWAANLGVDVSVHDRPVVDTEISVSELMEDLDWTAQVHVDGQRGAHGLMFDIFDIRLATQDEAVAIPSLPGADAVLSSEIGMTILEVGGIYDPRGDHEGIGLVYGARILRQSEEVDARYEGIPEAPVARCYTSDETFADALVGVRYIKRLTRRLTTAFRADASAGGTELTWSTTGSLTIALGKTDRYAISTGYRRMDIAFKEENAAQTDMTLSGFFAGLRMSF